MAKIPKIHLGMDSTLEDKGNMRKGSNDLTNVFGRFLHFGLRTVILGLFLLLMIPGTIYAMIPFYAMDPQADIYDWNNLDMLEPEIAALISEFAVVYEENGNEPGDAELFDGPDGPFLTHYVGFTNFWFGDGLSYLDAENITEKTKAQEGNFYHSTDPSTITAWRAAADKVEIHWTPDLRFVSSAQYDSLNISIPPGSIEEYLIIRKNLGTSVLDSFTTTQGETSFTDTTVVSSLSYSYMIESIYDANTNFTFSAEPVTVGGIVESEEPHFWVEKEDYQERIYVDLIGNLDLNISVAWPIKFVSNDTIDPTKCTLEVYKHHFADQDTVVEYTGLVFDNETRALTLSLPSSSSYMRKYGGVVYRLRYQPDENTEIYFPAERDGEKHLIWSTINNRVMSCGWLSYQMNVEGTTWPQTYLGIAQRLAEGVNPTGVGQNVVQYDGVFMDSVMGTTLDHHNKIKPYEYSNKEDYRDSTVSMIKNLCQNGGLKFYANTIDLNLMESLENTENFAGTMDDNFVHNELGWKALADALWVFRGHPQWQNLFQNNFNFGADLGNRIQALAAYLILREPVIDPMAVKALFGYGPWNYAPSGTPPNVNILPEQMINVGDAISDPFSGIAWPTAAEWESTAGTNNDFIGWLEEEAGDFVITSGGCRFGRRWYELIDGLPSVDNEVFVVYDLDGTLGQTQITLGELFPEKEDGGPFYPLVLEGQKVRLVDGGYLATGDSISLDEEIYVDEKLRIFFTAPISSPHVEPYAVYALPRGTGAVPCLAVKAHHWNGVVLDTLRVDASSLGWDQRIILTDADNDSIYTYFGSEITASVGVDSLPFVAIANDGLRLYGNINVQVTEPSGIVFENESLNTGELYSQVSPTATPYASAALDYNLDGSSDLFISYAETENKGFLFLCDYDDTTGTSFTDRTLDDIAFGSEPVGNQKGIAVANIDADALPEFFVAHPQTPQLFSINETSGGKFVDIADSLLDFNPGAIYDAAWADYDLDGLMDLVVARSPLDEKSAKEGGQSIGITSALYHHVVDTSGEHTLEIVGDTSVFPQENHFSYEVVWCNVDGTDPNGRILWDIFICDAVADQPSALLINQGPNASGVFEFENETTKWFPADAMPIGVRSVVFADFDNDGDDDLATACWGQKDNLTIYKNSGTGFSVGDKSKNFLPPEPVSLGGLSVGDFDGNHFPDLIIQPYHENSVPYILLNGVAGSPGVFSRFNDLDLGTGKIYGTTVADWGGDGDPDLYLGRAQNSGSFFYENQLPDNATPIHFIRIQLCGGGGENGSGIGGKVEVLTSGFETSQVMWGKNGRNSKSLEILFPLAGCTSDSVDIRVNWPSGHVQDQTCSIDALTTIFDDSYVIDGSTIVSSYMPGPNGTDWTFEWVTKGPTVRSDDYVKVYGPTDPSDRCFCGGNVTLREYMSSVDLVIEADGDGWLHTLTWHGGCCIPGKPACVFSFDVFSGNYLGSDSSINHAFTIMSICGSGF